MGLSRVTKPSGYLYVVAGTVGGLIEKILPSVREFYIESEEFKQIIDTFTPQTFAELLGEKILGMRQHTDENYNLQPILELLDEDLCVTFQNIIQVPTRLVSELDETCEVYPKSWFSRKFRA